MFIGHYALGLAAKRVAPRTGLGTLFIAPTLADLLWPIFLLLGWEHAHVVPGTLIVWGAVFGCLYKWRTGDKRAALVIALLVVSHWVLDFITHRPDEPLYPGGPAVGLGLWSFPNATVIVESVMLIAGLAFYLSATRARDAIGRWGIWALVAVLAGSYYSTLFTPTPTDIHALAIGGIIFGWVFVLLAWWVDRHRDATTGLPTPL